MTVHTDRHQEAGPQQARPGATLSTSPPNEDPTSSTEVAMLLDTEKLVEPAFPPGISVRNYVEGDEQVWVRIHNDVGVYGSVALDLYRREFGEDADALSERQFFVVTRDGQDIATATAWFPQPHRPSSLGRLHWLAVVPAHQRRGIASALVRTVCAILLNLGYSGVYLTTATWNLPAISLYRSLGFRPYIVSEEDARRWSGIKENMPDLF